MEKQYDVVVIGAGSGGLTAAVGFSKVGKKVALIEKEHLGGECTNSGCIPSKALLHRARAYHHAVELGGGSTKTDTYRNQAFTYVRSVIEEILKEETPEVFETLGIDVVSGEAVFNTKCSVTVGEDIYHYKHAVIATGSSPRPLTIDGLNDDDVLTNQNIFQLEAIPEKTLIIGAGPIGLEMGQALAMLGSDVTIATIDTEFAHMEDPAIRPIIQNRFESLGIKILLNAHINRVDENVAKFEMKHGDETERIAHVAFDKVLVAVGRVPNLPTGLDAATVTYDERCILVDGQHRTSNKYVYALGDVAQRLKFTHTADDSARQVVARVVSKGWLRVTKRKSIPKVTYTSPEIAQVGLAWDAAVAKYGEDRLMRVEVPFSTNDRAKTDETTAGHLVVIARRINGAILGAHIIGPNAGELIAVFTLAIDQKISMWKLQSTIFAYPTYSLVIKKAGDYFVGTQFGSLKSDVLNTLKRQLPKIIAGVLWLAVLWLVHTYQQSTGMTATETALQLFQFVSLTVWGPLVYIAFYAVRPVLFFPATILTILSGIFFGLLYGTLYTIIAATLSAIVAYGVGRFFGKNLKLEDTVVGNWIEGLRKNTFSATLITRLIFMPFDLISYLAGILHVRFLPFVTATILGIILGTATFVSIGASLNLDEFIENGFSTDVIETRFIILSGIIFVVSLGLSKLLKRWKVEM